jgi:hypothetical protein
VIHAETGAGGGREEQDQEQLLARVERHAETLARRRGRG